MTHWTKNWVAKARIINDPAGDLIADLNSVDATTLPPLFHNIHELRRYLISRRSSQQALAAVPIVWRRYQSWLDRHPGG